MDPRIPPAIIPREELERLQLWAPYGRGWWLTAVLSFFIGAGFAGVLIGASYLLLFGRGAG